MAGQHRELFTALLRPDFRFVSGKEVEPYFRDLQARIERHGDQSNAARDAVNGAFDIYVSHVSHRTDQVMKFLTVVSTLILPATIILGVFGTSFTNLPIYDPDWFWVMLAATAVLTAGGLVVFRRKRWI